MPVEKIVKWLGFVCILAGLSRMGMTPTGLIWGMDSAPELKCGYIASLLMGVCSIALYLPQSKETGFLGFIAAFVTSAGNIIIAGELYGIFAYGSYAEEGLFTSITGMLIGISMMVGTILIAFVTFRAKVFPLWNAILFVLILVSFGIPFLEDWFAFFWGLAYVGMGYTICTGKYNKKEAPNSIGITA